MKKKRVKEFIISIILFYSVMILIAVFMRETHTYLEAMYYSSQILLCGIGGSGILCFFGKIID